MGSWVGGGRTNMCNSWRPETTCWWNKESPRLDSFLVNGRILVVGGNRCKPSFAGIRVPEEMVFEWHFLRIKNVLVEDYPSYIWCAITSSINININIYQYQEKMSFKDFWGSWWFCKLGTHF